MRLTEIAYNEKTSDKQTGSLRVVLRTSSFFEGQELAAPEILRGLKNVIASGSLIPILCVSAKTGVGFVELLDAIADFALAPGGLVRHGTSEDGADVEVTSSEDAPFVGQVFKTRMDPFVSKMSFIRVLSGKLTKDSMVRDMRTGKEVKVHQMLDAQGGQVEIVAFCSAKVR